MPDIKHHVYIQCNTTDNNALFTSTTITTMADEKNIHPAMARLYDAAIALKLIDGERRQSALARLLNVPSQNVKHWERRGPSKEVRLRCQAEYGINATWVETGDTAEAKKIPPEKPSTAAFNEDERALLEGFRNADGKDRETMLFLARRATEVFNERAGKQ